MDQDIKSEKTFLWRKPFAMRELIIDMETMVKIKNVIRYAEENIFTTKDLLDMIAGKLMSPDDDPQRVITIPDGYRTVYSLEERPDGRYRRISISIPTVGMMPGVPNVQEIIKRFGFTGEIMNPDGRTDITIIEIGENHQAIQFVENVDGEEVSLNTHFLKKIMAAFS